MRTGCALRRRRFHAMNFQKGSLTKWRGSRRGHHAQCCVVTGACTTPRRRRCSSRSLQVLVPAPRSSGDVLLPGPKVSKTFANSLAIQLNCLPELSNYLALATGHSAACWLPVAGHHRGLVLGPCSIGLCSGTMVLAGSCLLGSVQPTLSSRATTAVRVSLATPASCSYDQDVYERQRNTPSSAPLIRGPPPPPPPPPPPKVDCAPSQPSASSSPPSPVLSVPARHTHKPCADAGTARRCSVSTHGCVIVH